MFYGYRLIEYGEWNIPISTPEKTLIDIVYYNYPFMDEIIPNLSEKIDVKILKKMIEKNRKLARKINYVLSKYI